MVPQKVENFVSIPTTSPLPDPPADLQLLKIHSSRAAQRRRMFVGELRLIPEKSETHNFMGVTNRGPEMRSNL